MEANYAYANTSSVSNSPYRTALSFAPDTLRQPTYFSGELLKSLEFREAVSVLHHVVVSDMRFKPKDKTAYKEWAKQREDLDWLAVAQSRAALQERLKKAQDELNDLLKKSSNRSAAYNEAKQKYFHHLYQSNREAWYVLDPVITVHPDEVFFECFSQDESTYGRLGVGFDVFRNLREHACGTTNIDYSHALYQEFQKIRSYKTTKLEVDPSGFNVKTQGEADYREVKIDLPDTWVRGFLQVSAAMGMPSTKITLHPQDLANILFVLKRHKERMGPRSLRYVLTPGDPVTIVLDPWGTVIRTSRSLYEGPQAMEIRTWGRRRLMILERLLPISKQIDVYLMGYGLPSFYVADLGDMSFTLGLSGWVKNDWSSSGNFDLLAPRDNTDDVTKKRVFDALRKDWFARPTDLAKKLSLSVQTVQSVLMAYTQAGRVMFDLSKGVYRTRELSREPLPLHKLRFSNEREELAERFLRTNQVIASRQAHANGQIFMRGSVREDQRTYTATIHLDSDGQVQQADCDCDFFKLNKLHKGPCEHIIAVRLSANQSLLV